MRDSKYQAGGHFAMRLILIAFLCCALLNFHVPAQYRFDTWTTDNGLP